jgi:hypothetical protein
MIHIIYLGVLLLLETRNHGLDGRREWKHVNERHLGMGIWGWELIYNK